MARLDLGEGPGDHRPPPATFGGREVKSSGYGVTHPRRFLGQPIKVGTPVRAGARVKRGPGVQHEYPMSCGPLIDFQKKNAMKRNLHKGPILRMEYSPDGAHLLTCGADPLMGDPLSSLEVTNTALWDAVGALTKVAPHAAVLGGGGYNPWTVARCWTGLWGRLAGYQIPDALPEESGKLLESLDCDLVDDEDEMQPHWTTTLADPRNDGTLRDRFREIAAAVLAPEEEVA